jgi:hypothetical protein
VLNDLLAACSEVLSTACPKLKVLCACCCSAGIISCLSYSPIHNDLLAAGSYSRCIGLFDARTYEQLLLLEGHKGGLTQVKMAWYILVDNAVMMLSHLAEGQVCVVRACHLWDVLCYLAAIVCRRQLSLHRCTYHFTIANPQTAQIQLLCVVRWLQVSFSPDGNFLYSGARQDSQLHCWDIRATGQVLYSMSRCSASTNQRIGFSIEPCGRHLATGGCDGAVRVSVLFAAEYNKWAVAGIPVTFSYTAEVLAGFVT